ncbi:MAG TPA: hypothetical protein VF278_00505 [Pirellulales bacterium]
MSTARWTNPVEPLCPQYEVDPLDEDVWREVFGEDDSVFTGLLFCLTSILGLSLFALVVVSCVLAFGS